MRTVRGPDGRTYLLVKQSSDASRVRDPETGESPLETAARAVPESVRRILVAVPTERGLGLLVDLVDRGPLPVVDLLGAYDLCESDLHGLLTEFRVAGLVAETTVYGERGYEATDAAREGVELLRANGGRE
ncbi:MULTISPECIES: DUF7346 family protein [Haloferax]|uniref:HTH arsR-type domain-containing protein n=1 Tax=Haloferax massiliensis TaxID=1476858 RepID=A0A0D6JSP3_9EURY|nr:MULTISPECIES: hypothetical protein [Haloferax]MDS0240542.1 hypothetical protein [Haloferax sp. S2CR25]MDS0443663.1 hypothetical protein [Haloferax sp. S2CR25-2]CQR50663.1 hypothetical protein BN996_02146 [Haloferax massiliensis]